jgi:hypothetical protein
MRRVVTFVAPWLPLWALWALILRIQGVSSLGDAAGWALLSVGAAALLAIPARALCDRLPWPSRLRYGFALRHAAAASIYGLAWVVSLYTYDAVLRGRRILDLISASYSFGWQLLMGVLLYGMVAAFRYATRLREQAEADERRAVQAEAQAATARLEAIRARLHPHFLFNALHSVGVLVRSDPPAAEVAVESLGRLLREALGRDGRPLIPLEEEWAFSRRYLEFERIRYGERLGVAASFSEDALDCLVPPFSLHTLIENAVRHSVAVAEGGRIEVRAQVAGDRLNVEVEDQGAPASAAPPPAGQCFGLAALRERIETLCGAAGELETAGLPAGGFRVIMRLPARRSDEAGPVGPGAGAAA